MSKILSAVQSLGGQTKVARLLGVTQGVVWQWINGRRPLPPRRAVQLEQLCGGAHRADDICDGFEFERDASGVVLGYRVRVQRPGESSAVPPPPPADDAEAA